MPLRIVHIIIDAAVRFESHDVDAVI